MASTTSSRFLVKRLKALSNNIKNKEVMHVSALGFLEQSSNSYDDEVRTKLFLKDKILVWGSIVGYVGIAIVSIVIVPRIFYHMKWYYVMIIYIFAPVIAFCNA